MSFFLVSVGTICGITSLLAVLMVIADSTIGDYGMVKITVNNDKVLNVEGGRSLLSTLMEEKIFIPSACGGRGSCGLCKVKVEKGGGEYLPTELSWIGKDEMKQNIRLSCQLKVKEELSIRIPDELFRVKEFRGRVESIVNLTHDIKGLRFRLEEPDRIDFRAGQFIQFRVPAYELTPEPVYRAYSIASSPSTSDYIELEIRLVPNGICTTFVFNYLKEGDQVTFNGPYGEFYLRDTRREIIFIAGGSGMAPIRGILLKMAGEKNPRRVRYFFGARSVRDLFLVDEMKQLEKELPDFRFIPALSQPLTEDGWEGETGIITDVVAKYVESGDNVEAYLCGSPGMIDACVKTLTAKGVPEELIYYDKFA